jgi:hypothetical protein
MAEWVDRNLWAEPCDLNFCCFRALSDQMHLDRHRRTAYRFGAHRPPSPTLQSLDFLHTAAQKWVAAAKGLGLVHLV